MSRVGNAPIPIPDGVEVAVSGREVAVKGPKGELSHRVADPISVAQDDGAITVSRATDRGPHRALHGLSRALIANMMTGVSEGFERHLELQGVGYRASMKGTGLRLNVGYSHPVEIEAPEGITFEVPEATEIVVRGIDKQAVGQIAARIRKVRPPEPYKGKGIRYRDEDVQRKVGKRA